MQDTFTEKHLPLFVKLAKVQQEVPDLIKSRDANAGKYTWQFIPLESVYDLIHPVLVKYQLHLFWLYDTENTSNTSTVTVIDGDDETTHEYAVMQYLTCVLVDLETGVNLSSKMALPIESFQEVGKRITYYLGRMLLGMIGRVAEKDTGGEEEAEDRTSSRSSRKSTRSTRPSRAKARAAAHRQSTEFEPEEEEEYEEEEYEEEEYEEEPEKKTPSRSLPTRTPRRAY